LAVKKFESLPVDWSILTLRRLVYGALNDRYAPAFKPFNKPSRTPKSGH
jgi:hypothetical protein